MHNSENEWSLPLEQNLVFEKVTPSKGEECWIRFSVDGASSWVDPTPGTYRSMLELLSCFDPPLRSTVVTKILKEFGRSTKVSIPIHDAFDI